MYSFYKSKLVLDNPETTPIQLDVSILVGTSLPELLCGEVHHGVPQLLPLVPPLPTHQISQHFMSDIMALSDIRKLSDIGTLSVIRTLSDFGTFSDIRTTLSDIRTTMSDISTKLSDIRDNFSVERDLAKNPQQM